MSNTNDPFVKGGPVNRSPTRESMANSIPMIPWENAEKLYRADLEKAQNKITELQQQVQDLMKIINAKENSDTNTNSGNKIEIDYQTEEEDLAKETEWIRVKAKSQSKKRRLNNTPSPPQASQNIRSANTKEDEKKTRAPPPIVLHGMKNYNSLRDVIRQNISEESFSTKLLNGDKIKINLKDSDSYRELVKILAEGQFNFHSYENKSEKPIRVMAKNLHHTCDIQMIKDELIIKQFKIIEAINKISFKTKKPLDMFILTFSGDENVKAIHEIRSILGCKVEIEPLRKSKIIPQCKRCQSYGHTQKYCHLEARCVKCAGHHLTLECDLKNEGKAKCVHCGESHPANYRGCLVAKEIQNIKNKKLKDQRHQTKKQQEHVEKNQSHSLRRPGVNYSDVVAGEIMHPKTLNPEKNNDINQTLHAILAKLNNFDDRLKRLESNMGARPKNIQK